MAYLLLLLLHLLTPRTNPLTSLSLPLNIIRHHVIGGAHPWNKLLLEAVARRLGWDQTGAPLAKIEVLRGGKPRGTRVVTWDRRHGCHCPLSIKLSKMGLPNHRVNKSFQYQSYDKAHTTRAVVQAQYQNKAS